MNNLIPHSDTVSGKALKAGRRLVRTGFANLMRDSSSGVYFSHAKVRGKLLRKSLKTKSREIAKIRLDELLRQTREVRQAAGGRPQVENFHCKQLADLWAEKMRHKCKRDGSPIKPRAIAYRLETLQIIRLTWPKFDGLKPHAVTTAVCEEWCRAFRRFKNQRGRPYHAGRFNGCLETVRSIFALAVELGLMARNPAMPVNDQSPLNRVKVPRKKRRLPSRRQFAELLRRLRARPERRQALWFVRVLAYSFKRPVSLRALRPSDVDLKRNMIRWSPVKHDIEAEELPMSPPLRVVMKELLKLHPGGNVPLLPILDPKQALKKSCLEAGITPAITSGDLRHWATTQALLSAQLPVAMVALLRGDKDGGVMMSKTYLHADQDLLRAAVKKL